MQRPQFHLKVLISGEFGQIIIIPIYFYNSTSVPDNFYIHVHVVFDNVRNESNADYNKISPCIGQFVLWYHMED